MTTQVNLQDDDFANLQYEGPVDPTSTGGWYNSFRYGQFTLAGLVKFAAGNKLRLRPQISAGYSDMQALTKDILNRWVMPGDEAKTSIPAILDPLTEQQIVNASGAQVSAVYPYNLYNYSTERVVDGDYIKLANVSLSYRLPESMLTRARMSTASLSVVANNIWLIYSDKRLNGQDPEFFASGGVAMPSARQITLSLQLGL